METKFKVDEATAIKLLDLLRRNRVNVKQVLGGLFMVQDIVIAHNCLAEMKICNIDITWIDKTSEQLE